MKKNASNNKIKKPKRRLGMGLSSLLSKDQELASIIKSKVIEKVNEKIPSQNKKIANMKLPAQTDYWEPAYLTPS